MEPEQIQDLSELKGLLWRLVVSQRQFVDKHKSPFEIFKSFSEIFLNFNILPLDKLDFIRMRIHFL